MTRKGGERGRLVFEVRLSGGSSVASLRARVTRLALGDTVLISDRRLELDARNKGGLELVLSAPEGDFDALGLGVSDLELRDAKGAVRKGAASRGDATLRVPVRIRRDRPARASAAPRACPPAASRGAGRSPR